MPYITIKEAAERLGVSEKTARRMIKDGRLAAELRDGPYGRTYYIDEADIQTAQEITNVVPVTRPMPAEALANAITAKVTEALRESEARTREELEALRQELAATREAQERIERSIEERDRKLVEALRTLTEKKERRAWWERILRGGQ